MVEDALALLELDAVASGLRALDALVKQAPVRVLEANLVEPGRFLILLCGPVAEVDERCGPVLAEAVRLAARRRGGGGGGRSPLP